MTEKLELQVITVDANTIMLRYSYPGAGEPFNKVTLPYDKLARTGILQVLEKGDLSQCQLDKGQLAALCEIGLIHNGKLADPDVRNRKIGEKLFTTLFPNGDTTNNSLLGTLRTALSSAQKDGKGLPFQLKFDADAADLAQLPWELICENGDYLVANGSLNLTRYITFGEPTVPIPVVNQLEILVVTARPEDLEYLNPAVEFQVIHSAFQDLETLGVVRIKILKPPTLDALIAETNAHHYHILHFDGHGGFGRLCPWCKKFHPAEKIFCNPGCGSRLDDESLQGCLAFEQSENNRNSDLVTAFDLGTVLKNRSIRLCVASACQSGTVGGVNVFNSIGPRLIRGGIPAVLAMQFSIPEESAKLFITEFYKGLARADSIADAVSAGRRILWKRNTWYFPTLYLRCEDAEGQIFGFHDNASIQGQTLGENIGGRGLGSACIYLQPLNVADINWGNLRPAEAAPYKYLSPYEVKDNVVFKGRDAEIENLKSKILQSRYMILRGPARIGKTSLINAGLIPKLVDQKYLILTLRDYDDPVNNLLQAVAQSPAIKIDITGIENLCDLAKSLVYNLGRPVVIVLDEFDKYLLTTNEPEKLDLLKQLINLINTNFPLPVSLLLVIGNKYEQYSSLLEGYLPDLSGHSMQLDLLPSDKAAEAVEKPLEHHLPALVFDPKFLKEILLPDLYVDRDRPEVNPIHLQIICNELYLAALRDNVKVIGKDQYHKTGIRGVFKEYLAERIKYHSSESIGEKEILSVLKEMVSLTGNPVFVTYSQVINLVGQDAGKIQGLLDGLQADGILIQQDGSGGAYSLGHKELVEEVKSRFDRDEAMTRCAQETLNRAADDWLSQVEIRHSEKVTINKSEHVFLIEIERLKEIREAQERAKELNLPAIRITPLQYCLLLRSAVFHHFDINYWAPQIAKDNSEEGKKIKDLLGNMNQTQNHVFSDEEKSAGEVLGLKPENQEDFPLTTAIINHPNGNVRHTCALALAILGMDAVDAGLKIFLKQKIRGRHWRIVQALAQIKAAGFNLPGLGAGLQMQVELLATVLLNWDQQLSLGIESLTAGLACGLGMCISNAIASNNSSQDFQPLSILFQFFLLFPLGFLLGCISSAAAWLLEFRQKNQSQFSIITGRVIGLWLGFLTSLLLFWLPFAYLQAAIFGIQLDFFKIYVIGGSLWAVGIALGRELLVHLKFGSSLWKSLIGGGIGGGLSALLILKFNGMLPLVDAQADALIIGIGIGGSLAFGIDLGRQLWDKVKNIDYEIFNAISQKKSASSK